MEARKTTEHDPVPDQGPRARTRRERAAARLRGDYEEDGVFRPVRLPLLVDLAISAAIIAVAASGFAGFIAWLASTQ